MIDKEELISFLESEKWYPIIHPTNIELETSYLLEDNLNSIISRIENKRSFFRKISKSWVSSIIEETRIHNFQTSDKMMVMELYNNIIRTMIDKLKSL
jgi:hypothetical protein